MDGYNSENVKQSTADMTTSAENLPQQVLSSGLESEDAEATPVSKVEADEGLIEESGFNGETESNMHQSTEAPGAQPSKSETNSPNTEKDGLDSEATKQSSPDITQFEGLDSEDTTPIDPKTAPSEQNLFQQIASSSVEPEDVKASAVSEKSLSTETDEVKIEGSGTDRETEDKIYENVVAPEMQLSKPETNPLNSKTEQNLFQQLVSSSVEPEDVKASAVSEKVLSMEADEGKIEGSGTDREIEDKIYESVVAPEMQLSKPETNPLNSEKVENRPEQMVSSSLEPEDVQADTVSKRSPSVEADKGANEDSDEDGEARDMTYGKTEASQTQLSEPETSLLNPTMDSHDSEDAKQSTPDMTASEQNNLQQLISSSLETEDIKSSPLSESGLSVEAGEGATEGSGAVGETNEFVHGTIDEPKTQQSIPETNSLNVTADGLDSEVVKQSTPDVAASEQNLVQQVVSSTSEPEDVKASDISKRSLNLEADNVKIEGSGDGEAEEKVSGSLDVRVTHLNKPEPNPLNLNMGLQNLEDTKQSPLDVTASGLQNLEDTKQSPLDVTASVEDLPKQMVSSSSKPETAQASAVSKSTVSEEANKAEVEGSITNKDTQELIYGSNEAQGTELTIPHADPLNLLVNGHDLEDLEQSTTDMKTSEQNLFQQMVSSSLEPENVEGTVISKRALSMEMDDGEIEDSGTDGETEEMVYGSTEAARQFLEELEKASGVGSHSGANSSNGLSQRIDGQIVTDSDEEADTDDEEGDGKELFDSAALAALLKAATGDTGSDGGSITITSQDGSRLFSVERPAGLGTSLRSVKPAPRSTRPSIFNHSELASGGEPEAELTDEERNKLEKLQQLKVKFLRLVQRLGQSPEDPIAAQVLYRLALLGGRQSGQQFSLDSAKKTALQLEEEEKDDLNFSVNILVLGKAGVGKSATINSIFGEEKSLIHAFEPATMDVREITGTVDGVKLRVIDTPGLKSSAMEQGINRKVLSAVKNLTKKCPPDLVIYVDRLDTQTRDLNDMPLLKTISGSLGSSIWQNAIVTLTHAASAPPDGPTGMPLSYEVFVAQRSHVVQQSIGQAVGDLRLMNPTRMNPVSLVENHPSCRKNRDGQKVLPNGQTWRPQLLLLCYSIKILAEASSLSKPQDPFDHRKLFGFRTRSPPLPYLLSWLLQSRTHPKLPADQGGENVDSDMDLDDVADSDQEDEEDEYDQLPPFKPLRRAQLAKLKKEHRKAYFEEYDYRVKLLQKKQWREELKRMREMKKKSEKTVQDEYGYLGEEDPDNGAPAAVPVPLPDMSLPPSFDSDNPAYRYRFLEPTSQFLARPVLDTHGWDHDCGYDGVNVENSLAIASRFPTAVTVQVTKDKKEFNIHLDSSVAVKHGENGSTMAGFDIQNVGKQLAYIVRGETKFKNFKKNRTTAGASVTFLGENIATGVKVEDQIPVGKRLVLVGSTGTVRSQGDAAYGANLEVRLREADFPIGQDQSSLGLSLVKWRGDLALGANLQSQFSVGRNSKIAVRAGLNNKLSGQITVRTSSSDQLQIALMGILPIVISIYKHIRPGVSDNYSMY